MVRQKTLLFQFSTTAKLLSFFGGLFLSSGQLVNEKKVYFSTLSPGLVSAAICCSRWHIYIPSLASSTWRREEASRSALCSLLTDQQ